MKNPHLDNKIAALGVAVLFSACSKDFSDSQDDQSEPIVLSETSVMGSEGGEITLKNGARLRVPAQTLFGDEELTLEYQNHPADDLPAPLQGGAVAGLYAMHPDGLIFAQDFTLRVPIGTPPEGADPDTLAITYFDGSGWIPLNITERGGGFATASLKHFSRIGVNYDFRSARDFRLEDLSVGVCGERLRFDFRTPGGTFLFFTGLVREFLGGNGHYAVVHTIKLVDGHLVNETVRTLHVYTVAVNEIYPYTLEFNQGGHDQLRAGHPLRDGEVYVLRTRSARATGTLTDWNLHQYVALFDEDGALISDRELDPVKIEPARQETARDDFLLYPTRSDLVREAIALSALDPEHDHRFEIDVKSVTDGAIGDARARFHSDWFNIARDRDGALACDGQPARAENSAPSVTIESPRQGDYFEFGDRVDLRAAASDPEDGALTGGQMKWYSSQHGLLGEGARLEAPTLAPGVHILRTEVTDSAGVSSEAQVRVWIQQPRNTPPRFTSSPSRTHLRAGELWSYAAYALDGDGDEIRYRLQTAPTGMEIGSQSGTMDWSPSASDAGEHTVAVIADDGHGEFARQEFVLTVQTQPNRPPLVEFTEVTKRASAGGIARFACEYEDYDNDTLEVVWGVSGGEIVSQSAEPCEMSLRSTTPAVIGVSVSISDGQTRTTVNRVVNFECVAALEICDGTDNDCDAQVDEGNVCCEDPCGARGCGLTSCGEICGFCAPGEACTDEGACRPSGLRESEDEKPDENRPPVVRDAAVTPGAGPVGTVILIEADVRDPDGAQDITQVRGMVRERPADQGEMYDDGGKVDLLPDQPGLQGSGDRTAGNGIYSMSGYIDPSYTPGVYNIDITATDQSGATAQATATFTVTP